MIFDFPYTCPNIDKSLDGLKSDIENNFIDMIKECCPILPDHTLNEFIKPYVDSLFDTISINFEDVRSLNSDMRDDAEKQINSIHEEKEDLIERVQILEDRIYDLEHEIKQNEDLK